MTTFKIHPSISRANRFTLTIADRVTTPFADITNLVKLNNSTGQLDEDTLVCDLQRFFDAPDVDRSRDLRLWRDASGKLKGFGQLLVSQQNNEMEGYLYFDVHPTWRSAALETEIIQWSERRMCELSREYDLPVKLRTRCHHNSLQRRMQLEKEGFTIERSFSTMACSLQQPISYSLPNGFSLQRLIRDEYPFGDLLQAAALRYRAVQDWVELFNESFVDHWNHQELTVETAKYWLNNPHYKPELNLIAVAPDGTLAAFCVGYVNVAENIRTGRKDGWIKLLGTRRGFRKLGLGRAMLLAVTKRLQQAGVEQVKLGVDAESLTGATRLYESIGFAPISTWLSCVKPVSSQI